MFLAVLIFIFKKALVFMITILVSYLFLLDYLISPGIKGTLDFKLHCYLKFLTVI